MQNFNHLYQAAQDRQLALREQAERERLAQQIDTKEYMNSARRAALANLGRKMVNLGEHLQEQYGAAPKVQVQHS